MGIDVGTLVHRVPNSVAKAIGILITATYLTSVGMDINELSKRKDIGRLQDRGILCADVHDRKLATQALFTDIAGSDVTISPEERYAFLSTLGLEENIDNFRAFKIVYHTENQFPDILVKQDNEIKACLTKSDLLSLTNTKTLVACLRKNDNIQETPITANEMYILF